MGDNIIDRLMQTFRRAEKDAATLTATEGGESIDLIGGRKLVSKDFDTMLSVLLYDKEGQKASDNLYESGNVEQLRKLWEMGGSPELTFGGEVGSAGAFYTRGEDSKINLLTHGSKREDYSSKELLEVFIQELSHGIGEFRPSLNKMSRDEIYYELIDKNTSLFDPAVSPADSSLAYNALARHEAIRPDASHDTPEKRKHMRYTMPGAMEHQTHSVIANAVKFWIQDVTGIDLNVASPISIEDWGSE